MGMMFVYAWSLWSMDRGKERRTASSMWVESQGTHFPNDIWYGIARLASLSCQIIAVERETVSVCERESFAQPLAPGPWPLVLAFFSQYRAFFSPFLYSVVFCFVTHGWSSSHLPPPQKYFFNQ